MSNFFLTAYYFINTLLTVFLIVSPAVYFLIIVYLFRDELKRSFPQLAFFLLLTTIFLNKLLFTSQSLAQKDFNNIQIPLFKFFNKSITKYFLPPIWDSSFCGGFDSFSNPLAGYFSVFNWVFLIGADVYKSFSVFILIQIFLCLVFSYLMLRTFSFTKSASVLGAVVFSFNGFVAMRLSPGVGIEYLFAYKWVPLILAFSKKYFDSGKTLDMLGIAIAFAFSMEGNANMVIAAGVLWLLYVLFQYKKLVYYKFKILLAPITALFIYAIKVIPIIDLFTNSVARFEEYAVSWRSSNFDLYMYPEVFFPIKADFTNGVFTPGVIGICLFFFGFLAGLIVYIKTKKPPFSTFYFMVFTFILSFFITRENALFDFFYSLPVLNRVTIIPSFLIFYLIPIVFFAASGFSIIIGFLRKTTFFSGKKYLLAVISIFVPLAIFAEVLIGPSTFGNKTYTFNFAKIDYKKEISNFPHYNVLKNQPEGVFLISEYPHIFVYPYAISKLDLSTLNHSNYFFGCNEDTSLIVSSIDNMKRRADYILSLHSIQDDDLELVELVSMGVLRDHKSHAVFERIMDYYVLYDTLKDSGWNDELYIYRVDCSGECSIKNYSDNPISFTAVFDQSSRLPSGKVFTSINYSKWLKARGDGGNLATYEDEFGYLGIESSDNYAKFFYVNPYIFLGFVISLFSFIFVVRYFLEKIKKN